MMKRTPTVALHWLRAAVMAAGCFGVFTSASCSPRNELGAEKVCDPPGANFLCHCEGQPNSRGTQRCKADGSGFEACVCGADLDFDEDPPGGDPWGPRHGGMPNFGGDAGGNVGGSAGGITGGDTGGSGGGEGGNGAGGSGAGGSGGSVGPKAGYLGACAEDKDCESDYCLGDFCTVACTGLMDCNPNPNDYVGECFQTSAAGAADAGVCMPVCDAQSTCSGLYEGNGRCIKTDNLLLSSPADICAPWCGPYQDNPAEPCWLPEQAVCASDFECTLGEPATEFVCVNDRCFDGGCHVDDDCPTPKWCGLVGAPGIACKAGDMFCVCRD